MKSRESIVLPGLEAAVAEAGGEPLDVPGAVLDALARDVVPHIRECCRVASAGHDLDPEFNDNYVLGTYAWRNLFNRLSTGLDRKRWKVVVSENDLRLALKGAGPAIELRIHRCEGESRIPTCGKRAKKYAADQFFLSDAIAETAMKTCYYVITYDLDPAQGLGSITLVRLFGMAPRDVLAETVAVLYQAPRVLLAETEAAERPAPEMVQEPLPIFDTAKAPAKRGRARH